MAGKGGPERSAQQKLKEEIFIVGTDIFVPQTR